MRYSAWHILVNSSTTTSEPNRAARRFVLLALVLAIGLAGGMAFLNLAIDPFNRYGINRLGVYISAERECKSTYVTRYAHDALLLGNSREVRIPVGRLDGFRFFNAAFSGTTAEEIYYFVQHHAWHEKLVVLAVDIGACDPKELHGDIFARQGLTSDLDNLLNLQTTEYSIRTISESMSKNPQPIGLDGTVPVSKWIQDADQENSKKEAFMINHLQHLWDGYQCPPIEKMSFYVKISQCLRERGIPCVVMIPPTHEAVVRTVQDGPAAAEVVAWKQQLRTIFPNVIDLSYSSYDAATNFYRSDPVHFKPDCGVDFINTKVLPFANQVLMAAGKGGPSAR
jgi:hypothetical protein